MTPLATDRVVFRRVCFALIAVQVLFLALTLARPWIPQHDGLYSLLVFHDFISSFATSQEFPLWSPLTDWGKPFLIETIRHITPGMFALAPLGALAAKLGIDSKTLFQLALFTNELILFIGVLALGSRLYKSQLASLFSACAVLGSLNYFKGLIPNLNSYYALPLCMYFAFRAVQERRLTWALVTILTLVLTCFFGNAGYFVVINAMALAFFTIGCVAFLNPSKQKSKEPAALNVVLLVLCAAFACTVLVLVWRLGWPHIATVGRGGVGRSGYDNFLEYGPVVDFTVTLLDLLGGVTHNQDFVLFSGLLAPPLALLGLLNNRASEKWPILLALGGMSLFGLGAHSFMAPILYYVPVVPFFRHLAFALPIAKLCLCFLAGFGVESLVNRNDATLSATADATRNLLSKFVLLCTCLTLALTYYHYSTKEFPASVSARLFLAVAMCIFVALAKQHRRFTLLLLLLASVDLLSYRFSERHGAMFRLDGAAASLFRLHPLSYSPNRTQHYTESERFNAFSHYFLADSKDARLEFANCFTDGKICNIGQYVYRGGTYNVLESFVGVDPCKSAFRSDHHLPNVHWLYDLDPARGERHNRKIDGIVECESSKLLLFGGFRLFPTQDRQREFLATVNGEKVLTFHHGQAATLAQLTAGNSEGREVSRVPNYAVTSFSANQLSLRLQSASEITAGEWLYYADAWHKRWSATVDGIPVPLLESNQGFKAIPLPPGATEVRFVFGSAVDQFLYWVLWFFASLFSVGTLVWGYSFLRFSENSLPQVAWKENELIKLEQTAGAN